MLESLEDVEFAGMEDMVDYLLPLMCGNVSAVLEDDKPAAALDMMVYPLSDHTHLYTPTQLLRARAHRQCAHTIEQPSSWAAIVASYIPPLSGQVPILAFYNAHKDGLQDEAQSAQSFLDKWAELLEGIARVGGCRQGRVSATASSLSVRVECLGGMSAAAVAP